MNITGTLIKNYFHCKRQAYLFHEGLNFYNEKMRVGEVMHAERSVREFVFEKIKVDDIIDNTIIEYKKTSANLKGTRFQVLHYLNYFQEKGKELKGKIIDLTYNQEYDIVLGKKEKFELEKVYEEIKQMLSNPIPPRMKLKKNCKGCSFFEYCWV